MASFEDSSVRSPAQQNANAAERAASTAKALDTNRLSVAPPTLLTPHAPARDDVVDITRRMVGQWTPVTPQQNVELEKMRMFLGADPAFGQKFFNPDQYYNFVQTRRAQQQNLLFVAAASKLIDPRDPTTQRDAYAVAPELESVVEENFKNSLAQQAIFFQLVQRGRINTRDEMLFFVATILNPDYAIPITATWDPGHVIVEEAPPALNDPSSNFLYKMTYKVGRFNNIFGENQAFYHQHPGATRNQILIKSKICQRILPAFRGRPIQEAEQWVIDGLAAAITNIPERSIPWKMPEVRNPQAILDPPEAPLDAGLRAADMNAMGQRFAAFNAQ